MTRQEFIEDVNSFGDLIFFCQNESIDTCDDIYDADYLNVIIMENIASMRDWTDVKDFVTSIPAGCDYYREDGYGRYEDAEYYFDDYKEDVVRYMDASNLWDDEEENEWDNGDVEEAHYAGVENDEEDIDAVSFMAVLGR